MANELPYFRFTVQAWQNGKINMEDYELQGFFISVCGFYWVQDCNVTFDLLTKKFNKDLGLLTRLFDVKIVKKKRNLIEISFLNEQFDLLSQKRKINKANGLKGSEAKARLKRNGSYKDKDKDNNKDKSEFNFDFVEPNFKIPFDTWVNYRIERKKPFTLQVTLEAAYKELKDLSGNQPLEAIKMVQKCMSSESLSLYRSEKEFKNKNTPETNTKLSYAINK